MTKNIIAVYGDGADAVEAVRDLTAHGISPDMIRINTLTTARDSDALMEQLDTRAVPRPRAELYAEALRRGAAVVIAETDDAQVDEAVEVLDAHHSVDIDRTADRWRASGWAGYQPGSAPYGGEQSQQERQQLAQETFDVVQEEVRVGKREVDESVRIRSFVTERPVHEEVELHEERVDIRREPTNEPLSPREAAAAFTEGEVDVDVSARSEEPVVERTARVVERVHVRKDEQTRVEPIEETERRRDVEVEPASPGAPPPSTRKP